MDDTSNSTTSSEFFSPTHARRQSLQDIDTPPVILEQSDSLPRLQDNSWIGARVSPIQSFDEERDDEEDDGNGCMEDAVTDVDIDQAVARSYARVKTRANDISARSSKATLLPSFRKSLPNLFPTVGPDERTHFLSKNNASHFDRRSWNHLPSTRDRSFAVPGQRRRTTSGDVQWAPGINIDTNNNNNKLRMVTVTRNSWKFVSFLANGTTGSLLGCMVVHDGYLWYIAMRRDIVTKYSTAWSVPWLSPTARTLVRFGAYIPSRFAYGHQYWRLISSMAMPSSGLEWILIVWAWRTLSRPFPSLMINSIEQRTAAAPSAFSVVTILLFLYIASAFTGQLWMLVFQTDSVSGCAAWGTCGVLCATGISQPPRRFELFLMAIGILVLDLVTPTSSVFGAIGGSFFGWAVAGAGCTRALAHEDNDSSYNSLGRLMARGCGVLMMTLLYIVPIAIMVSTS